MKTNVSDSSTMKVLKPDWISHNGMPICSIDIHPDGSRVATGGQGEDSGRIVIWNMAPVVSEKVENDEKVPPCVNCVRWSTSGKYLASGGDDKLVMVWTISKSAGNNIFGSQTKANLEGWRCIYTLRGHQGDVLDMAWSPNDHWLATCSVDNTVIVWRSDNLPEVVTVLKGHTGLVKGVSWDPVGKYLSSQSDDKSVRIWRTGDWHQEAVIKQPFEKCTGTTMVLRLSWSPDGQYLVTAHAMNGSVPTAQIIERDGWTHDKDFVGHQMAVTCVRFSGFIMESERKGKAARACACAIGSRDRSVSVWLTSLTRPVMVLEDLFSTPVLDISWGPRGLGFMACSGDGTTAYLEFTEQEIGAPISDTDKGMLFEKLYGKAQVEMDDGGGLVVIENPEVLMNNSTSATPATTPNNQIKKNANSTAMNNGAKPPLFLNLNSQCSNSSTCSPRLPTNKQIETRTADGRRRITPVYIPPQPDTGEEVLPFGSESVSFSSVSVGKSRIIVEKRDEVVPISNLSQNAPPLIPSSSQITPPKVAAPLPSSLSNAAQSKPKNPFQANSPAEGGGFSSLVTTAEKNEGKRKRGNSTPSLQPRNIQLVKSNKKPSMSSVADQRGPCSKCSHHRLPPLCLPPELCSVKLPGSGGVVRVDNNVSKGVQGNLSCVRCFSSLVDWKPKWELMLGSEVLGCVASLHSVTVACADHTVHILNNDGEHLVPPLALPSLVALLTASRNHLVCVTCCGSLYVWNLSISGTASCIISDKNISPILNAHEGTDLRIKDCVVTDHGDPMLALSSGKAYSFSLQHNVWFLIGNSSDLVVRNAFQSYKSSLRNSPGVSDLPLISLQTAAFNGLNIASRIAPGSDVGPLCTLTFLDTQLSCSKIVKSRHEYRYWLLTMVRFLLQQGMEGRLRRICEDLLGPMHSGSFNRKWEKEILGLDKHSLLREVLAEMASNIRCQRIYMEFKDQLDSCP